MKKTVEITEFTQLKSNFFTEKEVKKAIRKKEKLFKKSHYGNMNRKINHMSRMKE